MKIQLIDKNIEMCEEWNKEFKDCQDVTILNGDFFSLQTDCVVSPANSFGFMDGGLDAAISLKLGWGVQERLQKIISETGIGEILVGQAVLVESGYDEIPFCISAPTMRVPLDISGTLNVYLAAKAIFNLLKNESRINSVTISGLGTGVGRLPHSICAKQMKRAYDEVWLGYYLPPMNWYETVKRHEIIIESELGKNMK